MFKALRKGKLDEVKGFMSQGCDIHRITEGDKWSHLHSAFMSPSVAPEKRTPLESIQFLIDQGLDVNAVDSYGNTPLLYAVRQRNVDGMRLLLANGADRMIDHRNLDGIDALKMAFDRKPTIYDVVKLLLNFGADPDAKQEVGCSVRELLQIMVGVDPEVKALIDQHASKS
ncbi:ankyrin repeat domain-containing protein [Vibrio sp. PP-XX7]